MTETRLYQQLDNLKNIDAAEAMLPGAHLLRNAAYANYLNNTDPDAPEDEFMFVPLPPEEHGAQVVAREEFNINFIEFGTSKMESQPFMRPAVDANLDAIAKITAEQINQQLRELAK